MDTMRRIMLLACCLAACICVMDTEVTARVEAGASTASTTAGPASGQSGGGMLDEGLAGRIFPIPAGAQVVRSYAGGRPSAGDAILDDTEKLIYSNNGDPYETFFYSPPLARARIGDDIFTNAVGNCPINKFSIRVTGGIPNGRFERFDTSVALTTYCPSESYWGPTIPGTELTFPDLVADIDTIHELVVDFTDPNIGICANDAGCRIDQQDCYDGSECVTRTQPVIIPSQVWVRVEFSRSEAGWIVGAPPIIGFSTDQYDNYFTGCNTWFGGYPNHPHASFYAQFWASAKDGVCPTHFLAYLAFDAQRDAYLAPPSNTMNQLLADDIELIDGVDQCELSLIEVGTKGTRGRYEIDFDLRNSPSGNPFADTEFHWVSSDRAGNGNLELARLEFPDDTWVAQHFWITWKANKDDTGVINPQRNQAGGQSTTAGLADNRFMGWYGPDWAPPGEWNVTHRTADGRDAVFYFAVYCKGEVPTGPCCARQPNLEGQDPACLDEVPVTSCFGGRWLRSTEQNPKTCPSSFYDGECEDGTYCSTLEGCPDATCGTPPCECEGVEDPWEARGQPPCGTHACCMPDNECANIPRDECVAITDDDGRPSVWNRGDFCGFNNQRCPFFSCYYSSIACTDCAPEVVCSYVGDPVCDELPWPAECKMPDQVCTSPRGCTNVYCCDWVCRNPGNSACCNVSWDCTCKNLAQDCPGPPANDDCWDNEPGFGSVEINLRPAEWDPNFYIGSSSSSHLSATKGDLEPGMCCHNKGVNRKAVGTVWYKFRAALSGSVRLHTCQTSGQPDAKDSIIQVFSAPFTDIGLCEDDSECSVFMQDCPDDACDTPPCECLLDQQRLCGSLVVEGCNDDAPEACGNPVRPGLADLCIREVTVGELYYVMVGSGSTSQQGDYTLSIEQPCDSRDIPPDRSYCDGAETAYPGVNEYDLDDATLDCPGEECLVGMKNDVWFNHRPECTGYLLVRTCDTDEQTSEEDTTLAVYQGLNCPPGEDDRLGCNDNAVSSEYNHETIGMPQWCAGTDGECEDGTSCTTLEGCPDWTCAAEVDCECVVAACDQDSDCPKTCTVGGNACTVLADCDIGVCDDDSTCSVIEQDCVDQFMCQRVETCDAALCISACWPGAMVEVPVSSAEWYKIRVGGYFGGAPSGDLTIMCRAEDCNQNFVPDIRDILDCPSGDPTCDDCNQNNIPDICDLIDDPDNWKDCDSNLIPDRCQIRQTCFGPERPYFCNLAEGPCDPDLNNNCIVDECEPTCPIGDIVWEGANPPTGVIDARQPHPLNDSSPAQGIYTIVVDGPTGMNKGHMCFTLCETRVDGSANSVTTVTEGDVGIYTIVLDRPISAGAVTKISYHPGGPGGGFPPDTAVFTSLPADANASALPQIVDIAGLVSCCLNGTCPSAFGGYSCDTNYSGTVTGEDILRLIDLLHGADGFEAWKNVPPYDDGECP